MSAVLTVLLTYSKTRLGVLLSGSRTTSSSLMMLGPLDRFCSRNKHKQAAVKKGKSAQVHNGKQYSHPAVLTATNDA